MHIVSILLDPASAFLSLRNLGKSGLGAVYETRLTTA
jgi:hypothetical protein